MSLQPITKIELQIFPCFYTLKHAYFMLEISEKISPIMQSCKKLDRNLKTFIRFNTIKSISKKKFTDSYVIFSSNL